MRRLYRSPMLILAALALLVAPATAEAGTPKPPKKIIIAKLFKRAYCGPITALNGNTVAVATVTLKTVKIAAPRVGRPRLDGTPANRKTYVFPVRAFWKCDYRATALANPGDFADDKRISGDYVFFRDEFGSWTHRNKGHNVKSINGTN